MARSVIVTRAAREALRWVEALRAAGLDAKALPLMSIEPLTDESELRAARERVGGYAALMFVSAAAVAHFLDASAAASLSAGTRLRCWATGPGTVRALREAGVPASHIDAPSAEAERFDSEALWTQVQAQVGAGTRVLIVRGGDGAGRPAGRDWLAREIGTAGGSVDTVVAYRRLAPVFGDAERRLAAAAADDGTAWLFSSSEAIANLGRAMPGIDWHAARAIVTHPRIAEAARKAGFGRVRLSSPGTEALAASIESIA
jgi:uroporphyrinogen-III synthase